MKRVLELVPEKMAARPGQPEAHPYEPTDPIPVPEVLESDTDTAWALWEDSITPERADDDPAFASTEPDELATVPDEPSTVRDELPTVPMALLPKE